MNNKRLLPAVALSCLSALSFACSDDGGQIINSKCITNYDCPNGLICKNGSCVNNNNTQPESPDPSQQQNTPDAPEIPDDPDTPSAPNPPVNPDLLTTDSDGDTIVDFYDSCDVDTDNDGQVDCLDLDSDGDTIPDSIEAWSDGIPADVPEDSNFDDVYDFLSTDSDGNQIPDKTEAGTEPNHPIDTDSDGIPDYKSEDNDGDGLNDVDEIIGLINKDGNPGRKCGSEWCSPGTPSNPWDSDGDTIPDYLDPDSDGDTIPDNIEGTDDSDGDGILDRYDLDSDNDGTPDKDEVDSDGSPSFFTDKNGNITFCYRTPDCDGDALRDLDEISCPGKNGAMDPDQDGDGYPDGAEYVAAQYAVKYGLLNGQKINDVSDLICSPSLGVKDVFEFYFELPYGGPQKDDDLLFEPTVKKLDVVFNVDTTASMTNAINNVKNNIGNVISKVKNIVPDSGFGLTNFDDFPINCIIEDNAIINNTSGQTIYYPCGVPEDGDLPFRLLGTVSTDENTVTNYTKNALFTTRNGADGAESGTESLYQIAAGSGVSWNAGSQSGWFMYSSTQVTNHKFEWNSGSIAKHANAPNTWGGVDFRNDSLPVVIHTTDVYSHDQSTSQYPLNGYPSFFSYQPSFVNSPHYSSDLIPVLKNKGIRVITLNVTSQNIGEYAADLFGQMTLWARESNAVVPACAFENQCGGQCCLGAETTSPVTIDGKPDQCVLAYKANMNDVSTYVVKGIDALIKYGTYEVAAKIRGENIPGSSVDTSCFIKKVVASQYVAPPNEPEHSCNPAAVPTSVAGADYNNGFKNFAPGTSNANVKGAELHFTVLAQNDSCVEPINEAQVFTAYIEVYDPTTGVSFGERKVSIIVPAIGSGPNIN